MGWDRRLLEPIEQPEPLALKRRLLGAGVALLAAVLIFLLHASGISDRLQAFNVWLSTCVPFVVWTLMLGARAYNYGRELSHHRFALEQGQVAQLSWQNWAQRYVAVLASCVVMPDCVSAVALTQGGASFSPRAGQARRISALSQAEAPSVAGLEVLLAGISVPLRGLPEMRRLSVTILTDVEPDQYDSLRDVWHQHWVNATSGLLLSGINVASQLSYEWVSEVIKTGGSDFELILVLQTQGAELYSDGLAALLLCPDHLAVASSFPLRGALLRPMALDVAVARSEIELFLSTQKVACQAGSILADRAVWGSVVGTVLSMDHDLGVCIDHDKTWIHERLCGLPGPFSPWLIAALGVEVVQHQGRPLLMLAEEGQQRWISVASTGAPT